MAYLRPLTVTLFLIHIENSMSCDLEAYTGYISVWDVITSVAHRILEKKPMSHITHHTV